MAFIEVHLIATPNPGGENLLDFSTLQNGFAFMQYSINHHPI
jgi:hypothetical protein